MSHRIGELFAGYGGLGAGVQEAIGGDIAWFSEIDTAPSKILAHNFPGIPNHGDITKIDWSTVEPVDILTGGFPCQDVSHAGARAGLKEGTRSGLWSYFAEAISALKPELVVIENVRGLLSADAHGPLEPDEGSLGKGKRLPTLRALGAVLGDLARLGYDAEWHSVQACDAGAPHRRFRVFILAYPNAGRRRKYNAGIGGLPISHEVSREPATDTSCERGHEGDHVAGISREGDDRATLANEHSARSGVTEWGVYRPAIERWERVTGRAAPAPTMPDGKNGSHRLAAQFVEHMMGLSEGHVTSPLIGLTRNQQLKALGNGVVPQQATLALRLMLGQQERLAA